MSIVEYKGPEDFFISVEGNSGSGRRQVVDLIEKVWGFQRAGRKREEDRMLQVQLDKLRGAIRRNAESNPNALLVQYGFLSNKRDAHREVIDSYGERFVQEGSVFSVIDVFARGLKDMDFFGGRQFKDLEWLYGHDCASLPKPDLLVLTSGPVSGGDTRLVTYHSKMQNYFEEWFDGYSGSKVRVSTSGEKLRGAGSEKIRVLHKINEAITEHMG